MLEWKEDYLALRKKVLGKALFQYEPHAAEGNLPDGRTGADLSRSRERKDHRDHQSHRLHDPVRERMGVPMGSRRGHGRRLKRPSGVSGRGGNDGRGAVLSDRRPAGAPWNILAITFTNKAANELKGRLETMLGEEARDVAASTFHSCCVRILRREIERLGYTSSFTIYDADDSLRVVKDAMTELSINDKLFKPKAVLGEISRAKDSMILPDGYRMTVGADYRKQEIAKIYQAYQSKLIRSNAVDFDDIICLTVRLFEQFPEVLEYYQNRWRYIMVDEYQDTNHAQFRLVSLLAKKYQNLCVVGDDDQSIYKFRGATIENILGFEQQFQDTAVIRLEQNYRSTQTILDAANEVIRHNIARKGKNLWTQNGEGEKIVLRQLRDERSEAQFIADTIEEDVADKGMKYGDHAVLYRMNAQSGVLEQYFIKAGIPYRLFGGVKFFERKEIRDLVAYLSVINNPSDTVRLRRIVNEPKRSIGEATLNTAEEIAAKSRSSMFQVFRDAGKYSALSRKAGALMSFARDHRRAAGGGEGRAAGSAAGRHSGEDRLWRHAERPRRRGKDPDGEHRRAEVHHGQV